MILEDEPNTFYTDLPFQYLPFVRFLLKKERLPYLVIGAFFNDEGNSKNRLKQIYITFHTPEDCFSFMIRRDRNNLIEEAKTWQKQKNPSL